MSLERVYLKTGTFASFLTNIFNNKIVEKKSKVLSSWIGWWAESSTKLIKNTTNIMVTYLNELNRFNFSFFLEYSYMHCTLIHPRTLAIECTWELLSINSAKLCDFFFLYLSAHCARYKIGCIKALNSIEVSYRSHRCKQLDSTCTNSNKRFHHCGKSNKTKNEQTIRRTKCLLYQTNHRECDIGKKTVAAKASVQRSCALFHWLQTNQIFDIVFNFSNEDIKITKKMKKTFMVKAMHWKFDYGNESQQIFDTNSVYALVLSISI